MSHNHLQSFYQKASLIIALLLYTTVSYSQASYEYWRYRFPQGFSSQIPGYYNKPGKTKEELCEYAYQYLKQGTDNGAPPGFVSALAFEANHPPYGEACVGDYNFSTLPNLTVGTSQTFLRRVVENCPSPTSGLSPYDTFGCGCSNPFHTSLFDGINGGEEGCKEPPKDLCNTEGNPCQVSTGAKFRNEVDVTNNGLTFNRRYHSQNLVDNGLGKGWHNKYLKQLSITSDQLYIIEGNGRGEPWSKVGNDWQGDADSDYLVTETAAGFVVTDQQNNISEYTQDGRLLSETDAKGNVITFTYDIDNRLVSVTNHYGLSLSFVYSTDGKNHITSVMDGTGVQYQYEYDSNDNLVAVIFPDATADESDNPRKEYHYGDLAHPNHLTGITDANGVRHQTYAYDINGKAIESGKTQTTNAVPQEQIQLNYQD